MIIDKQNRRQALRFPGSTGLGFTGRNWQTRPGNEPPILIVKVHLGEGGGSILKILRKVRRQALNMQNALTEPVAIFLTIMAVILITPMLSERVRLPGMVGLILGGMLIGPFGINLLADSSSIQLLSTIGLVYLMFSAGLEVDLQQFNRVRAKAFVFGVLTYLIPQLLGIAAGRLLGLSWLGAVLLGSAFSSHTLIAFPILTRLGIVKNEAVSMTVGATVMTDISAFIVLAVVLGAHSGNLTPLHFILLIVMLVAFAAAVLLGLPRLGKLFFRRFSGRAIEFQFVLVVLFVSALGAEEIGVHSVVGAFLAGLAINATLPRNSAVSGYVLFLGEAFFIPVFLMYSGMITNPMALITDKSALMAGVLVTAVAYLSKLAAAWLASRIFHYSKAEFMTVWGLSQAQAAVTIPTLMIGLTAGLFSNSLFNAAIFMILLTSISSPLLVQHYGAKLPVPNGNGEKKNEFDRILVTVANPETQEHLISLAGILAHEQEGKLLLLNVAQEMNGIIVGLEHQQRLLERVPQLLGNPEAQIELLRRVDSSIAHGILHSAIESEASMIVLGWRGKPTLRQSIFGAVLDEVVWNADIPVLIGRMNTSINGMQRLALVIPPDRLPKRWLERSVEIAASMAKTINVPLIIFLSKQNEASLQEPLAKLNGEINHQCISLNGNLMRSVVKSTRAHDLIIVPSLGNRMHFLSSLGHFPELLATHTSSSLMVIHYPEGDHAIQRA